MIRNILTYLLVLTLSLFSFNVSIAAVKDDGKQHCPADRVDPELKKLSDDLKANSALKNAIKNNYGLLDAWDVLYEAGYDGNSGKRRDLNNLKNLDKLLTNNKLNNSLLNKDKIEGLISGNLSKSGMELEKLIDGLEKLVSQGTKFGNVEKLISDLNNSAGGGNLTKGSSWMLRHIINNKSEFNGKTLSFEDSQTTINGIRFVDLRVGNIYYEYKSVQTSNANPPKNFSEQFIKDLDNADNLNQLKWIFDGKENPILDKDKFLDAIQQAGDDGKIPDEVLTKYGGSIESLVDSVDSQFSSIFMVR